ncbi:MAG: ABC transporter substrate-binding protein [Bacteroidales bacterium]|nr:ABC transporter substrate-binding protein [Bacteroidales bacterium]MCM1416006.1 ABC transporter substrate-binding protein [bacterium]MCM1424919.1 ABC transporter substrate-binding protein [bacterium]
MKKKNCCKLLSLLMGMAVLLSACAAGGSKDDGKLVWKRWNGYNDFMELAAQTHPEIELELSAYSGGNGTAFSWAQMRADDMEDVFITSQILDEELASKRLADLSGYEFVNQFSTSLLDQVSIDGGVYLLPVNNAIYGITYNKTLMEEHGWELPTNFAELEALCGEIKEAGLIPGVLAAQLTAYPFSAVFNLAKTDWLTTMEGVHWEQDFLAGNATAAGQWEDTMDYVQKYIDIGMFYTDPDDKSHSEMAEEYLYGRKAVFYTGVWSPPQKIVPETGDELGIMPYIGEDGSKNIYMYSPSTYIGINKHLTEKGNEKKLEEAITLLSLLFSEEGQGAFINEHTPYMLSALEQAAVSEDSMIYDAQLAMKEGRAFPMTYAHWENVLGDMGQAFKEWFRGENGMDGKKAIARMDELQSNYLFAQDEAYFCESTDNFTVQETAHLIGKVFGSAVDADAAMIAYAPKYQKDVGLTSFVSGKFYKERINVEVATTIVPGYDGEYALLTMTGAQAKELAKTGYVMEGAAESFPYELVTKGEAKLKDDQTYQIVFLPSTYTEEVGMAYGAQVQKGSLREYLRAWLEEQKTISPDGNPWE